MREILDEWQGGIPVGGRRINNLRCADDTLIIASTILKITEIMSRLSVISEKYGLKINKSKTKIMIVDKQDNNFPQISEIAGHKYQKLQRKHGL